LGECTIYCCNVSKCKKIFETIKSSHIKQFNGKKFIGANGDSSDDDDDEEVVDLDELSEDESDEDKKKYPNYAKFFEGLVLMDLTTIELLARIRIPSIKSTIPIRVFEILMSELKSRNIEAIAHFLNWSRYILPKDIFFTSNVNVLIKFKKNVFNDTGDNLSYCKFTNFFKFLNIMRAFCKSLEEPYMFNYERNSTQDMEIIKKMLEEKFIHYKDIISDFSSHDFDFDFIPKTFQYYNKYYTLPRDVRFAEAFDILLIPLSLKYFTAGKDYLEKYKDEYNDTFKSVYGDLFDSNITKKYRIIVINCFIDLLVRSKDLRFLPFFILFYSDNHLYYKSTDLGLMIKSFSNYILSKNIPKEGDLINKTFKLFDIIYDNIIEKYLSNEEKKYYSNENKIFKESIYKMKKNNKLNLEFIDNTFNLIYAEIFTIFLDTITPRNKIFKKERKFDQINLKWLSDNTDNYITFVNVNLQKENLLLFISNILEYKNEDHGLMSVIDFFFERLRKFSK